MRFFILTAAALQLLSGQLSAETTLSLGAAYTSTQSDEGHDHGFTPSLNFGYQADQFRFSASWFGSIEADKDSRQTYEFLYSVNDFYGISARYDRGKDMNDNLFLGVRIKGNFPGVDVNAKIMTETLRRESSIISISGEYRLNDIFSIGGKTELHQDYDNSNIFKHEVTGIFDITDNLYTEAKASTRNDKEYQVDSVGIGVGFRF